MLRRYPFRRRQRSRSAAASAPLFARVRQYCTVVDDFEATIGNLVDHLGIGPFRCWHWRPPTLYDTTYRGEPAAWTMKLGITWLGDIQWEVIQPMDGPSVYRDHHDRHGRGVQHILMDTGEVSFERAAETLGRRGHPFDQTARINPPLGLGRFTLPSLPARLSKPLNLHFGYIDAEDTLRASFELTRYPLGIHERVCLRLGKPETCIPEGNEDFERSLANRRVDAAHKVTILTRDLEDTVRHWIRAARVGPWHLFDRPKAHVGWALIGNTLIEIVAPRDRDTPQRRLLDARGEAVATIGVSPRGDLDELLEHCRGLDYPIADGGALVGEHRAAVVE